MRIGILTQYYPPEIGAPQNRLSRLAKLFASQGHEVVVLTAIPNYPTGRIYPGYGGVYSEETIDGIPVIRTAVFPTKRVDFGPRLLNYFSFVFSSFVFGIFKLPRLDFLLTESPPLFLGITGFLLSRIKGARLIFNVSDLWPESAVRMGLVKSGLFLKMAWRLERFCYQAAWLVTCQSRDILANIQERFSDLPLHLLSNGVDTEAFRPELYNRRLHDELGEGRCLAVYAGLHGAAQGLEQVLHAAARLDDRVRIVLVGDGPEKEQLQRKAAEMGLRNVRFLAPFPHERMPELIASADVALVLLKNHLPGAVPSKIYEAMGSGVPVVLAADGEAARLVCESGAGLVVRPGDSVGIAEAITRLAEDPAGGKAMGERGRQTVVVGYDRRRISQGLVDLMRRTISEQQVEAVPLGSGRGEKAMIDQ